MGLAVIRRVRVGLLPRATVPAEVLFIDEGFGSFDPETLDVAIASLDALQSLEQYVGEISV